jgi:hypothetical protein
VLKSPPIANLQNVMRQLRTTQPTTIMTMKKTIYNIILTLSIFGIPFFIFGIINTMVSLKYETENSTDCISSVTDQDLCSAINVLKGLVLICVFLIVGLLTFRKQILRTDM